MSHTDAGSSFERPGNDPAGCACDDVGVNESHYKALEGFGQAESRCNLPIGDVTKSRPDTDSPAAAKRVLANSETPFVVQHGRHLYFLTWESGRWTLAELEFDAVSCAFVEQRRTHYEWPREAFGVLLSRFTLLERVETALLKRTSDDFARWLGSQFQIVPTSS